ncbi:MAG TPA: glycosyltransferase family 39 protein [Stellaceae bacterium]|nr:glycosyltransferase family 39 protein [Stellaceae bacterium]
MRRIGASRLNAAGRWLGLGRSGIPIVLAAIGVLYFLAPNARLDFSAFDTRDAESYLALSRSLVAGYGYTRSLNPHAYIPHTTWPPGLPLLLAPLTFLGGVPINLLLVKIGMIAYGVIGIVLAYFYAKRLTHAPLARVSVPLLLALNPYYWQFSRMTNSEMPTVVWALIALLLADIGWANGTIRHRTAFAFGLICGFGMLIRGSFFGALFLPLVYVFALRSEPVDLRRLWSRYICYAAGFLLPFGGWMFRNSLIDKRRLGPDGIDQLAMIFRTSPVDPASPFRTASQIFADALANLQGSVIYQIPKSIVPGLWAQGVWHELGAWSGPLAAFLTLALVLLSCRTARNLPIIVMYGSMAVLNILYAVGGMARLWVPVTCLIALSLPIAAETLQFPRHRRVRASLAGLMLTALAASLVAYVNQHEEHPYRDASYAALADLFSDIRSHDILLGNVLTPSPQAFALYTGLSAPMSVPAIGVDPRYAYVILPSVEWQAQSLGGAAMTRNSVWSLVALTAPMTLAEFREHYNCAFSSIAAFAVLSDCLIR